MATAKRPIKKPRKKTDKAPRITAAEKAAKLDQVLQAEAAEKLQPATKAEKRKAVKNQRPRLPGVLAISRQSILLLWNYRWLFLGITAIYAVLNVLLVRGLSSSTDISSIKQLISGQYHGSFGQLLSSLTIFGVLLASPTTSGTNSASDAAGVYQTILVIIVSLALVWALRQSLAGNLVRIRDAFYQGMYPLIPVLLIVLLMIIELVPMAIGFSTFGLVLVNGIASTWWQDVLWGIGCTLLVALSIFWLTSSLFAAYIASVPDMTPVKALRSANQLVRYRRWTLLRKLLFLPVALLLLTAVIVIPIIYIYAPAAPWLVYVLSMIGIAVIHSYLYTLYRELLV